VEIFTDSFTIY